MAHIIRGQEQVIIQAVSPDNSVNTGDLFVVSAANDGTTLVTVNGDLSVTGTQTVNNSVTTTVDDQWFKLNSGYSGGGDQDSGLFFSQGTGNNAVLYYDAGDDDFQIGTTTNDTADNSISNIALTNIRVATTPTHPNHAASKSYVDSATATLTIADDTSTTGQTVIGSDTLNIQGGTGITTSVSGSTVTITASNLAQGITLVGDDSTGTAVSDGETFKIAGGTGITTAVSGDTLTITGVSQAQGITVVGDDSTGTQISDGETVKIAGGTGITTAVSGDTLTITGVDVSSYITASSSDVLTNKTISNATNTITITESNISDLQSYLTAETNDLTSAVTWANVPDANITQSSVTQHQSALTITESQISDLGSYITATSGDVLANKTISSATNTITITEANISDLGNYITNSPINVVGDDSTGTVINTNETIKIAGAGGITTAVSGDTLTIDGSGVSSSGTITFVGDDSTGTAVSLNETVQFTGAGGITVSVSGDSVTIDGSGVSGSGDSSIHTSFDQITVNYLESTDSTEIVVLDNLRVTGGITTSSIQPPSDLVGTYTISSPTTITLDPTDEIINDAPMKLVSKTVSQLSTLVASAGSMVFCTDETGGAVPAFYDGSDWRRVTDRAVVS